MLMLPPQPRLPRLHNCLRPVRNLQLVKDIGDVIAHRFGADMELVGDLVVIFASGNQMQHFALAPG